MRPLAQALLMFACFCGGLPCQDTAALTLRESELSQQAAGGLHAIADALQAEKQHLRALELRREIWMDYDSDDERSREKTGFVRVGNLWRLDQDVLVLDRNLKAKRSKISRIDRDLQRLSKELLKGHRALAVSWAKLEQLDKASRHWRRILRFAPGDKEATRELALREFEGFSGNEHDLRMLRRGRAIHLACDWLNRREFPVTDLAEQRSQLLEAAGLDHSGVKTEFFTVWGSLAPSDLEVIARDCERALLLAHTMLGVSTGQIFRPKLRRNYVFVQHQTEYAAVLEVCKDQFSADRLAFLRDAVDMCFISYGGESLRAHKSEMGLSVARDQAVRGVMQDAVGIKADGLWEGLGHAACGFLFGQTLSFMEEQLTERTSAGHTSRRLAPDLETWMKIATESAWSKSDTRTSEIVLLNAARFTNEQRVKSWAICHYFAHWHPEFILDLDRSKTEQARTPPEVEAEFLRRTGYPLPKIDSEWRSFWARSAPLRAAMTRDPLPDKKAKNRKAVEHSRSLVDAINLARAAVRVGPLGYYIDASEDFASVRRYEKALARAEKEQAKREKKARPGAKVEPVAMPLPPAAIGKTMYWSRAKNPEMAVAEWLQNPIYRDTLLTPGRDLLAIPPDQGEFLIGRGFPAEQCKGGDPLVWPRDQQQDIPGKVRVADLDAHARAVLIKAGIAEDAVVGMPVSLHFARKVAPDLLAGVGCRLFEKNRPLRGVVVSYVGDVADGLVVCVPIQPLVSGKMIEAHWQIPEELLVGGQEFAARVFTVQ